MMGVSVCQFSHHPGYVIGCFSVQPAGHPACFDIFYDFLKHYCAESIITKTDGWAILVKNDRYRQSYRKSLYCLLDCQPILSAVGFLLEAGMTHRKRKQFVDFTDKTRGKEKVVTHKQHVGFNVKKPYRYMAVAI